MIVPPRFYRTLRWLIWNDLLKNPVATGHKGHKGPPPWEFPVVPHRKTIGKPQVRWLVFGNGKIRKSKIDDDSGG